MMSLRLCEYFYDFFFFSHFAISQMAPKNKVEEPEKKPLIGRVGTNLRVGIVGVPNVGKSTFFNVLTKSAAPAENFPFCTIDPNENKYFFPFASALECTPTDSDGIYFNRIFF